MVAKIGKKDKKDKKANAKCFHIKIKTEGRLT
jgi:hypothetical protein